MTSEDEVLSNAARSGLAQRFKSSILRVFRGGAIHNFTETDEVYSPIYTGPRMSVRTLDNQVNEEMKTEMRMLQMHINAQTVIMRRKQQARLKAFEEERGNMSRNDEEQNKNNNNMTLERLRAWVEELKEVMARKMVGECRKLSGGLLK